MNPITRMNAIRQADEYERMALKNIQEALELSRVLMVPSLSRNARAKFGSWLVVTQYQANKWMEKSLVWRV